MLMTENDWKIVEPFFKKTENWGDPFKMHKELIFNLCEFRKFVNKPVIINCAYETSGHTGEYHPLGMAVDLYVKEMNVFDMFVVASRFDAFNGIGVYPHWKPYGGLHIDVRPKKYVFAPDARWLRDKNGNYLPLNWQNIMKEIKNG